ncbi:MAG: penicillin-binding protein activator [Acidibrevibacterium sp.]|uniref:penicillin-binding protein activator n=1 Tax=Acidibrevibacterium sp. TaxID=2606776 RepID=UPI003CFD09E5
MRLQTFALLISGLVTVSLGLAGCANGGYSSALGGGKPQVLAGSAPAAGGAGGRAGTVALLLPLSGADAGLGGAMRDAAALALAPAGSPELDVRDTAGAPADAARAAAQAIAAGDAMILGPLTAGETLAVATPARAARVPVLAFTSDPKAAQPGVWTLGLTPEAQVRRLVAAARAEGRSRFVALLPESGYGHLMAQALERACAEAGLATPGIYFHGTSMASMNALVREVSDYANRRGPIEKQIREARAKGDRKTANDLAKQPIPPPPFDAVLLADTGEQLAELSSLLPYYDVDAPAVRLLGPALWAQPAARAGAALKGAWYAAPDPAARAAFVAAYSAKYGNAPPPLADLAYDAASLARVVAHEGGARGGALTASSGFFGADGLLVLQPDGRVRRGLAVFSLDGKIVAPAPTRVGEAGS